MHKNLHLSHNPLIILNRLGRLDSIKKIFISPFMLNRFESIKSLIGSLNVRFFKRALFNSVNYFESLNLVYARTNYLEIVDYTKFDCFSILYLIRFKISLNLLTDQHVDTFFKYCKLDYYN